MDFGLGARNQNFKACTQNQPEKFKAKRPVKFSLNPFLSFPSFQVDPSIPRT